MAIQTGCGVIFFDKENARVLLFLRDDKESIPFPNLLDLLGGEVEKGEDPKQAAIREIAEELEDKRTGLPYLLREPTHFNTHINDQGTTQHIFASPADFKIEDIVLYEGQRLVWLTEKELEQTELAFGFSEVVKKFFSSPIMERY